MKRILALFALILSLALTGCIPVPVSPAEDRTTQLEETEVDEATGEEGTTEEADDASEVSVDLGGTYEFADGLSVELSGVERGTSGALAFPENAPMVRFTVQLQNNTGGAIDTTLFLIQCQVGEEGRLGEQVFDYDAGLGDGFTSSLADGRNATADYGCEMPEEETFLQVEASLMDDFTRPTIFFSGDV